MKFQFKSPGRVAAFSILDLAGVVTVLAVLLTLLLISLGVPRAKSQRIQCVSHLKNIGLSFRIFATEHGDRLPGNPNETATDSSVFDQTFQHFLSLSNEFSRFKMLVCPADTRSAAHSLTTLANSNISYFVGVDDWQTRPNPLLAGDRNITNGSAPKRGVLELTPSKPAGWTHEIHGNQGNVVMGDGSVQQADSTRLNSLTQQRGQAPIPILLPE